MDEYLFLPKAVCRRRKAMEDRCADVKISIPGVKSKEDIVVTLSD